VRDVPYRRKASVPSPHEHKWVRRWRQTYGDMRMHHPDGFAHHFCRVCDEAAPWWIDLMLVMSAEGKSGSTYFRKMLGR